MVYPKSLRFNIAKALTRAEKNFKKSTLTGLTFKVWSIEDNGQKFYQAELYTAPAPGFVCALTSIASPAPPYFREGPITIYFLSFLAILYD
jgi:hypothetical protein